MKSDGNISLLVTCEHGGNDVPEHLRRYFHTPEAKRSLSSHRGYDPGSLVVARQIAERLQAPLEFSTISRLVVDLNRSLGSPQLFSKFIMDEDQATHQQILDSYYHPYRQRVTQWVAQQTPQHHVAIHFSVHTFTPRFRGQRRHFEMGVLFDPQRRQENRLCKQLIQRLNAPRFRVFANQPYLGIDDGLTTTLRTQFADDHYVGIEFELNNRISKRTDPTIRHWCDRLVQAIESCRM